MTVGSSRFNPIWLKSKDWEVIPFESRMTERDAVNIAKACIGLPSKICVGLTIEDSIDNEGYQFAPTAEALRTVSFELGPYNYALFADDYSFLYLRPFGLYSLLGGEKPFLETALGTSIEDAFQDFLRFAEDAAWDVGDRQQLLAVADTYRP